MFKVIGETTYAISCILVTYLQIQFSALNCIFKKACDVGLPLIDYVIKRRQINKYTTK